MTFNHDETGMIIEINEEGLLVLEEVAEKEPAYFQSNEFMFKVFKAGEMPVGTRLVTADSMGALSEAPCIPVTGKEQEMVGLYYYSDYQIRTPLQDIVDHGEVKFDALRKVKNNYKNQEDD